MTQEKAKELLPIIMAFAKGEQIQGRRLNNHVWKDMEDSDFSWPSSNYRIKPKPREFYLYRDKNDFAVSAYPPSSEWKEIIRVREIIEP